MQWIINIFRNPLTCSLDNLPDEIKTEINAMRQDLLISMESGIEFWKSISGQNYPASKDLILKTYSMFSTTYLCESTFSSMAHIKNKYRNSLTDSHLETLLKIKCYRKDIDIDDVMKFVSYNNLN